MFARKSIAVGSGNGPAARLVHKKPDIDVDAALVVFGRDDKGKAHASRFGKHDVDAATKAAHLMGFVALDASHETVSVIARELPEGRLFDSGKGFVPFVKEGVCLALEAHAKQFAGDVRQLSAADIEALDKAAAAQALKSDSEVAGDDGKANADTQSGTPAKLPQFEACNDLKVGMRVLAMEEPDDGWWEVEITHIHKSGIGDNLVTMLTLAWVDWPEYPKTTRRADQVAYFHPDYKPDYLYGDAE